MQHEHRSPIDPGIPSEEQEFILPNLEAVHEDNWQELAAQGVTVLESCISDNDLPVYLQFCQATWGTPNVLTGDAFDEDAQRPLRLRPGHGLYVRPEGWQYYRERKQRIGEPEAFS